MNLLQVNDDVSLLDLIIADADSAESKFDALSESRWLSYSKDILAYLRSEGLKDLRKPKPLRNSFGFIDANPSFEKISPEKIFHNARASSVNDKTVGIGNLPSSRVGSPEGFEIGGHFYTLSWLNFYCRYAYVSKMIGGFTDQVIVEIGAGSGKQAEMLKKAHHGLTIVIFDLPTQLYVCNQYLSKVFEGMDIVADYHIGRQINNFSEIKKGKINILPHWKFPIMYGVEFDLL